MENNVNGTKAELNKLKTQLQEQQKLASIGQLTAGIMHEIQNPLNFVNNFSGLSLELVEELNETIEGLGDSINDDNKADLEELTELLKTNLNKILQNGQRAESIIKGILLQSRGKPGVFQAVNLNELIREYVNLAYHGRRAENQNFNASFEHKYDDSIGKVNVIPQDFSRVILNIVNNACDAVYARSLLEEDYNPIISVSSAKVDYAISICIRDNGTGIPEKVKNKIFEAFFSTKAEGKGTGLGLAMAIEIISGSHSGSIDVISKENEFTEFIISIPTNLKNK